MASRTILSTLDRVRLRSALAKRARNSTSVVRTALVAKLRSAILLEPTEIPPEVTTMNSRVLLLSDRWPEPREWRLVYPGEENCLEQCVSVLSPLGVSLLGARESSTFQVWNGRTPFDVLLAGLTYQPEAEKHWRL